MSDLIDTTEMYLKTIYELVEEGIVPLRARIAERLGHSGPTVSQTVARMERDGLVVVTGDRHLELTEVGDTKAMRVMRKHRLAERLLTDVVGLEWEYVHEEACRWEHVMSDRVEKRLAELLDHPHFSPYGNPIPGLSELGEEPTRENFLAGSSPLAAVLASLPSVSASGESEELERTLVVKRLGEPLQTDIDLLASMSAAGVLPGAAVFLVRRDGRTTISGASSEVALEVSDDLARHVFVATE